MNVHTPPHRRVTPSLSHIHMICIHTHPLRAHSLSHTRIERMRFYTVFVYHIHSRDISRPRDHDRMDICSRCCAVRLNLKQWDCWVSALTTQSIFASIFEKLTKFSMVVAFPVEGAENDDIHGDKSHHTILVACDSSLYNTPVHTHTHTHTHAPTYTHLRAYTRKLKRTCRHVCGQEKYI